MYFSALRPPTQFIYSVADELHSLVGIWDRKTAIVTSCVGLAVCIYQTWMVMYDSNGDGVGF